MSIATNDKIESQRASKREKQSTHNILKWHEGNRKKKPTKEEECAAIDAKNERARKKKKEKKTEVKSTTEKSSKKGKIGPLILVVKDISICPRSS